MARMNTVTVRWRGVPETERALRAVPRRVRRGVLLGLSAVAVIMQNRCRQAIQKGPKTGILYRKRGVLHQASAPGEFPATDSGDLVRSIIGDTEPETLEATLSAGTVYAKWLEMGTRLMAPRPFLVPTLKKMRRDAVSILRKYINAEIRNG